jgi:uncharacterized membrane protein YbhN (UPF0104 family)
VKRAVRWGLALAVFAVLVVVALRRVDLAELWARVRSARSRDVVLAGLIVVGPCVRACATRLWLLVRRLPRAGATRPITVVENASVYYASCVAHQVLPAPSNDLLRLLWLHRHGYAVVDLTACQLIDRMLDGLTLALAVAAAGAALGLPFVGSRTLWLFAAASVAGLVAVLVVASRARRRPATAARSRIGRLVAEWGEAAGRLRSPSVWMAAMLLSLVDCAGLAAAISLSAHAVGLSLAPTGWVLGVVAVRLASVIPSLPGQLGVQEAGIAVAFVAAGAPESAALAAAAIYRVANVVPVTLVGLVALRRELRRRPPMAATEADVDRVPEKRRAAG